MQWHERIKSRVKLRELHTLEAVVQSGRASSTARPLSEAEKIL